MSDKEDRENLKIPQKASRRTARLLMSAGRIAGRELGNRLSARMRKDGDDNSDRLEKTRASQAKDLVKTLHQMKGAAMKAGQILSMEFADYLPDEALETLRELHDRSNYLGTEEIRAVLREALGIDRLERIKDFSPKPIAAASMGQVHTGVIDGEKVAIKIQYPAVAKTVESDLKAMRQLAETTLKVSGRNMDLDEVFAEMQETLVQETDYRSEAAYLKKYAAAFAADSDYRIPRVIDGFVEPNVLVMSYEDGERLNDWLKEYSGRCDDEAAEFKDWFGNALVALALKEVMDYGIVQSDANYGNFLVDTTNRQIVLLDFGATREYSVDTRHRLRKMVLEGLRGRENLMEESIKQGFIDGRESDATKDLFLDMMDLFLDVFTEELQPYDFSDLSKLETIRKAAIQFARSVEFSKPVSDVLMINRKLGGVFLVLKELGVEIDVAEHFARVRDLDLGTDAKDVS